MAVAAPGRTFHAPATLEDALRLLAELGPRAGVVAGGTDLVVAARGGRRPLPDAIVAIDRLPGLDEIEGTADGGLRIGALVTHADLERSSLIRDRWSALSDSSALVGSPATRHVGTLGGNLCNASPAMETGSPLLVFDAAVELRSTGGSRTLALAAFLTGPGRSALAPGELLVGVVVPAQPAGRVGSAYLRLEYRAAMEIAVVGAAALVALDGDGRCTEARIAITAVAPTVIRVAAAERIVGGHAPTAEIIAAAAAAAGEAARPIDDVRASARYRTAMVPVIVRRALEAALVRAGKVGA
ncbi:MAG TPA: xanthine dehydrogenase family protein subunit M [Candidatus Limnocylindrales bacterium]